jgi:hypothetical protein
MKRITSILALLALVGMTSTVQAQLAVDFTVPALNLGASVSYAGGANPLVGTGIRISEVTGLGTPLNNTVSQAVTSGVLNLTSGNFGGSSGPGDWQFGVGPANGITITGAVPGAGIPSSTTLLQGTILSATVTAGGGNFKVAVDAFINTLNSTLASYYGVPTDAAGNFNIGFFAPGSAPNGFSSTIVSSGDVISAAVPAPGFLVLLCSGSAVSLFGYAWRRAKAVAAGVG